MKSRPDHAERPPRMAGKTGPAALVALLLVAMLLTPAVAAAEGGFHVHIDNVDNSKFPQVDAYIAVSDSSGLPVDDLPATAFTVTEDGKPTTPQAIQPIENTQQPLAIALLVDTSTSMGSKQVPTPLQKAVEAAKSFIGQLTTQDQVALIKFSDAPQTVLPLTADKDRARLALDNLQPEKNRTVIYDAIVEGTKALKDFSGRRILVLVTDGKDTHNGLFTFETAVNQAQAASIPIYPLGFGNTINAQQLQQMAELTGGAAHIKATVFDLAGAFDKLLQSLRRQYKVSYISSLPANNSEHEILVTVNYQGGQQQAAYRFTAKTSSIPISLPGLQQGQKVGGLVRFAPAIDWPALKSLDILADDSPLASVTSAPFEYTWNSTDKKVNAGSHEFVFKATDLAGNTGQTSIRLDVQSPIALKVSNLTAAAYFGGQRSISVELSPSAGVTVQKVEIIVDGKVISTLTAPPYRTDWKVLNTAGPHVLTAKIYDGIGNVLTEQITQNVPVQFPGWIVAVGLLAILAVAIPLTLRSRHRVAAVGSAPIISRAALLREIDGLNPGQIWSLSGSEIRLGRKRDENDVLLKGLNASRRHATICLEAGQYKIVPLSPNNPVLINDVPVAAKTVLRPGDVIRLGGTTLRFEN